MKGELEVNCKKKKKKDLQTKTANRKQKNRIKPTKITTWGKRKSSIYLPNVKPSDQSRMQIQINLLRQIKKKEKKEEG